MNKIKLLPILVIFAAVSCSAKPIAPLNIIPAVTVHASLPGTAPEDIAEKLAAPIEREILNIEGVTGTISRCKTGSCEIIVTFNDPALTDGILYEVNSTIKRMVLTLPKDARFSVLPGSRKRNPDLSIALILTEPYSPEHHRAIMEFCNLAMQYPAAAQYEIVGKPIMETVIEVDPQKAASMKVNAADIAEVLKKRVVVIDEYSAAVIRTRTDEREIADIVVGNLDGTPVRIRDVASVTKELRQEIVHRLDGRPAVFVDIFLRPGSLPEESEECLEAVLRQRRPEVIRRVQNLPR